MVRIGVSKLIAYGTSWGLKAVVPNPAPHVPTCRSTAGEGTGVRARRSETSRAGLEWVAPSPTAYPENRRSNRSQSTRLPVPAHTQVIADRAPLAGDARHADGRRALSRHHRDVPSGWTHARRQPVGLSPTGTPSSSRGSRHSTCTSTAATSRGRSTFASAPNSRSQPSCGGEPKPRRYLRSAASTPLRSKPSPSSSSFESLGRRALIISRVLGPSSTCITAFAATRSIIARVSGPISS